VTPRISITAPQDAETLWLVRDRVRFMGDVAGTDLSVVEVEVPAGSGTPPHRHASVEIFRVLSGEITFGLFEDGPPRQVRATAGTVVTVPSDVGHNYANTSEAPASMLVVVERSMTAFFRELGSTQLPPAGPPTDAEIAAVMAACARHGIVMLGGKP
jgi:quercetin dioxygenase-like cupin family protein